MVFTGWMGFVLLGMAAAFSYHLWIGWRTRIVRFPMSILSVQEFEHDQSPVNFWGVMIANLIGTVVALVGAGFVLDSMVISSRPVTDLRVLDGCYDDQGTPDFMRSPTDWFLRVDNGSISNKDGDVVARLRLLTSTLSKTSVAFSPGISIATDNRKFSMIALGDTVAGVAYLNSGRATISFVDHDWDYVLVKTSCSRGWWRSPDAALQDVNRPT